MSATRRRRSAGLALLLLGSAALANQPAPWHNTATARLAALALTQTLNAELLASTSATLTLERWCHDHAMAEPALIVARKLPVAEPPAGPDLRQHLQVDAAELLRFRRVELRCGAHVLSVADNWYVPARLTPEMNQRLDDGEAPFGKVVQPLHPHRETLGVTLLWSPMPEGWQTAAGKSGVTRASRGQLQIPPALFEHRAIVYTDAQRPVAEVHEVYQRGVLEFPEPRVRD